MEGFLARKSFTISDGKVTATGDSESGIIALGPLTISGGKITATGKYAIDCIEVVVSGGEITATGGEFGLYSRGKITISGDDTVITAEGVSNVGINGIVGVPITIS